MKNCNGCSHYQEGGYCDSFDRFFDADNPHVWCRNKDD